MIIGGVIGGASQVYANLVTGNPWSDGLAGAVAGGAIYAFLSLAPFGNPVLAAFGAAFVESVTNEIVAYSLNKKTLNQENIEHSVESVINKTIFNTCIYYATGKVASKIEPLNKHWIKPTKIITCFTGNYARKVANQSFAHALLTLPLKRPVMVPCIH